MPQETNLNVSPYFDDFSPSNDFHRVLFKPGYPIQARELTTLQSILQNQIEKFGDHIFREGSKVIPGQLSYQDSYYAVQVEASYFGIPVSLYAEKLIGQRIQGEVTGVTAKVVDYITEGESDNGNLTFYVQYEKSSKDFAGQVFRDGETLLTLSSLTYSTTVISANEGFANAIPSNATSTGSAVRITEGVYFLRGNFVRVAEQTLILDQYTNTPSYRVGLSVVERIVQAGEDDSLYDNAQGFNNFTAPGADRLQISAVLSKRELDELNDENFVEIMRLVNGQKQFFQDDAQYSGIRDALAKRTFDESGNYYVKPFRVKAKETLNDRKGNKGVYVPGQLTQDGNTPSSDLMTYQISPGKAYVRGYDVETISNTNLDVPKARTTGTASSVGIDYNTGVQIITNRVFGAPNVGLGTTSIVSLRDQRVGVNSATAAGTEIGKARVYNFSPESVNLQGTQQESNEWDLRLFDIQTHTTLGLSTGITLTVPTRITGQSSGAEAFLVSAATDADSITVYCNGGSFVKDESIKVNGNVTGHVVETIRDFGLNDVFSVQSNPGVGQTFNADLKLTKGVVPVADSFIGGAPTFNITAGSGLAATITSPGNNFAGIITTGNYISYPGGNNDLNLNRVTSVSDDGNEVVVAAATSVSGVFNGSLPGSAVETQALAIRSIDSKLIAGNTLLTKLPKNNVADIDILNSSLIVKKQFRNVTISNSEIAASQFDIGSDFTYMPFTATRYVISYSDGSHEPLTSDQVKINATSSTLEFKNLSRSADTQARVDVTLKKSNPSSKEKQFKLSSVVINNSRKEGAGAGVTSLDNGLTFGEFYGTRVEDEEICLNVPDVVRVLGVYESNDTNNPDLPSVTMTSLSGPNATTADLVLGEEFITSTGSVGLVVEATTSTKIGISYVNSAKVQIGDIITFQTSGIQATVTAFTVGDRNILEKYIVDTGQRPSFYDYGRIIRRKGEVEPSRRLKIVYHHYDVPTSDEGDVFTVKSYDADRFDNDIFYLDKRFTDRLTDYIDVRPRVSSFTLTGATRSPFEFDGRSFTTGGQSVPHILSDDETLTLTFDYYLPRIDRLFLTTNGSFQIQLGTPAEEPVPPQAINGALDIGTMFVPSYTYEADQVKTLLKSYKRYRMSDIGRIDQRVKNLEYYTALSLLESDTKNMSIKDADGLDRFKCGFLVDNFKNKTAQSRRDPDFNASIDRNLGEMRPSHYTTAIDLLLGTNSIIGIGQTADSTQDFAFATDLVGNGCRRTGDLITLDYDEVKFVENVFASRTENVQPFAVIFWRGELELNPSSDVWVDTRRIDAQQVTVEGDFEDTVRELGADENTGLVSTVWNAWQTDWIGVDVATVITNETRTQRTGDVPRTIDVAGNRGWGAPSQWFFRDVEVTAQEIRVEVTNEETTTRTNQSRTGLNTRVVERIDSESLGDRVVDRENLPFMRSRNIEFVITKVKPRTQLYPFFEGEDVSKFCFPKLLEVTMDNGTFQVGETVIATPTILDNGTRLASTPYAQFRVAVQDHKYGPYNAPTDVFTANPYDDDQTISSVYTSTSTILNVDTFSLQLQPQGQFYGFLNGTMTLRGQTSGAQATVTRTRLISDNIGTLLGSFFIPDATIQENPQFTVGTKSLRFTSSPVNSLVPGTISTAVERNYESSGVIETIQETIINTRNAEIVTEDLTDNRVLTDVQRRVTNRRDAGVISETTTTVQQRVITRWSDPLAQTFSVPEPNGIFLTSVDLFFSTKDADNLPCGVQVRTVRTGSPTTTIIPFSVKDLPASQINVSTDASVPTRFTFDSPIFLEGGEEYALIVISPSLEYNVWISRLGEEDISTAGLAESQKVLITQQPYLGSLFKSQNASTWSPSQFEDLKFTLYKAEFEAGTTGTVNFFNPELNVGNNELVELSANPLVAYSRKVTLGLSSDVAADTNIIPGVSIAQTGSGISGGVGNLVGTGGSVGVTTESLLVINPGTGYTVATTTGIQPYTITGSGSGLEVSVTVAAGTSVYNDPNNLAPLRGFISVTNGGDGYKVGDVVGIPTASMNGLGQNATMSIVSIGFTNTLFLDNVQGDFVAAGSSMTYVTNTGIRSEINGSGSNVIIKSGGVTVDPIFDGKTIKVRHRNHAMHESNNLVKIDGIVSDIAPATLSNAYGRDSTADITISAGTAFTSFEGVGVGSTNPGYLKVSDEIIKYTGVSGNTITGVTRAQDSTVAFTHPTNSLVYKYEFNNVSLRRINKTHNLSETTNKGVHPITMDGYYISVDTGETSSDSVAIGTNRENSGGGFPSLYFDDTKTGGESRVTASQNIQYEVFTPNVQTITPKGTSINSRVRTVSARSVSGIETSFVDQGYSPIRLNDSNYFTSPRMVASKVNEDSKLTSLPGSKSLNMQCDMVSNDVNVSPVIDIDRVSAILTTNRIDDNVTNFATDGRVKIAGEDPNSATYVTKNVGLRVPATGLKVMFSANRASTSDIRVAYAVFRSDVPENELRYELFPGFDNLDENGIVIDPKSNSGHPDKFVPPSQRRDDFKEYEFTIEDLKEFNGFKIKIMMTATNQAYPPLVREFRTIALS